MISQQKFVFRVFLFLLGTAIITAGVDGSILHGQDGDTGADKKSVSTDKSDDQKPVSYEKEIKVIIEKKCFDCHCHENDEGSLNFEDLATIDDLELIVPGNHKESPLHEALVTDDEDMFMPPPHEEDYEPLTSDEVALVARWIDEGASFTDPVDEVENGEGTPAAVEEKEATPAKELDPMPMRIWRFLGSFHPALVHFPIALFSVGAFFVIFCGRNMALANEASFYCLALGALGAIVASAVGWSLAFESMFDGKPDADIWNMSGDMFWHRWSGVIVTVLSVIVWFVAWRQRSEDYADGGGSWKLGLILLAGIVGYVGYEGGELAHKEGYYFKQLDRYLPEAHEAIFPEVEEGENDADGDKADISDESADESADSNDKKKDDDSSSDKTGSGDSDKKTGDPKSEEDGKEKEADSSESDSDIDA